MKSLGGIVTCIILLLAVGRSQAAQEVPALKDCTWSEDFENGTISGWDSYPAFEDTAFDFTIIPGHYRPRYHLQGNITSGEYYYPVDLAPPGDPVKNKYYLLRAYRPNSASSQLIGAIYKLPNLYAGKESTLDFDYWLQLPRGTNRLRVELAGGDGQRYQAFVEKPADGKWVHVSLPLSKFRATQGGRIESGLQLQALAVIAELERGNPSSYVFVALDNTTINGQARVGFTLDQPETKSFEHWAIQFAQRHYRPGDTLQVEAASDSGPLESAWATLKTYDDKPLIERIELTGGPERFRAASPILFDERIPHGPLTLTVQGRRRDGSIARSDVRLWNLDPIVPGQHPRVMVGPDDRERVREAMSKEPYKQALDKMLATARTTIKTPTLDSFPIDLFPAEHIMVGDGWARTIRPTASRTEYCAWAYYLSGDEEIGRWVKDSLIKMTTKWDGWVTPWFRNQGRPHYFPVGQITKQLGIAYDLIYPLLTPEEAAAVRRGLIEKGIKPAWEEWFANNRVPFSTSNWIAHGAAMPAMTMMAIMGDGKEGSGMNEFGEPYFSTLNEKFLELMKRTQRADGGYGEDYSYGEYTNQSAQLFLYSMERLFGVTDLTEQMHYLTTHLYPSYITIVDAKNNASVLAMGDSYEKPTPGPNYVWAAAKSPDPLAKWFCKFSDTHTLESMLLGDPAIDAETRTPTQMGVPPCRVFPLKGNAVFRTGWETSSTLINFRAGPNYNHTHLDMGNFRFVAFGRHVVSEGGHCEYYRDPHFWSYFSQSGGHNCILVDDNIESQMPGDFDSEITGFADYARLKTWVVGDGIDFASADLAPVYRNPMKSMERRLYFAEPGYVVIHDRVRSADGAHSYQWQLHPPARENLAVAGRAAQVTVQDVVLDVAVAAPTDARLNVKPVPFPMEEYEGFPQNPIKPRAVLQVINAEPSDATDFVVALLPRRAGEPAWKSAPIDGRGYKGIRVETDGKVDTFCFAVDGTIHGDLASDGASAFSRLEGGKLTAAACEAARTLKVGGVALLEASTPISAACTVTADGVKWSFNCPTATTARVLDAQGGLRQIELKPGESTQTIR